MLVGLLRCEIVCFEHKDLSFAGNLLAEENSSQTLRIPLHTNPPVSCTFVLYYMYCLMYLLSVS